MEMMEEQVLESSSSTCSRGVSEAYHGKTTNGRGTRESGISCRWPGKPLPKLIAWRYNPFP